MLVNFLLSLSKTSYLDYHMSNAKLSYSSPNHFLILFERLIFLLIVRFHRIYHRLVPPSSLSCFISGYSFELFALSAPLDINRPRIIFIPTHRLESFILQNDLPTSDFTLISHNTDSPANLTPVIHRLLLNPSLRHWFVQNLRFQHPKATALPIGLENIQYLHNGIPLLFKIYQALSPYISKQPRALYGFNVDSNPASRLPAYSACQASPIADFFSENPLSYLRVLSCYQFVVSPPGNGIDCHRTWEALYLNVIPIVLSDPFFDHFPSLPFLILDSWDDLLSLTPQYLDAFYQANSSKFATSQHLLRMTTWLHRISTC